MVFKSTKRTVLLMVAVLCASTISMAQFTGGGRLGVNFSNLRGSSVEGNSMLIGYNIGGFVNYGLSNWMSGDIADILSVQSGLSVQTKGSTLKYSLLDANGDPFVFEAKQVFTYAEIPLLAKFTFRPSRNFSYFGEAGFFLGALTGLTIDSEKSWDHDQEKTTDPRKYRQEYSGFDLGVAIGAGVSVPFGGRNTPWSAFANIRGSIGLMNIGEEKEKTPDVMKPYLEDVKTGTLSLLFGVAYAF